VTSLSGAGRHGLQPASCTPRHGYAGTDAAARRAFDSSSARNALKLKLAEIASTPMPMRSIKSSGETACVADPRSGFENNADADPRHLPTLCHTNFHPRSFCRPERCPDGIKEASMERKKFTLCPACTEVEITDQGVTIGEEANTVRLSHAEWNELAAREERQAARSCLAAGLAGAYVLD